MTITNYLPDYVLAQLSDRVAFKLPFIRSQCDYETIWKGIHGLCRQIEEDPCVVNSVIVSQKKEHPSLVPGRTFRFYHLSLTRVYILLYYKHGEDPLYQEVVFPELEADMDIFAKDDCLKTIIQSKVKKIRENNKKVRKSMQDKQNHQPEDEVPEEDADMTNVVRMSAFMKCFSEKNDIDFKKQGSKADMARLMSLILGIPYQTCANFLTESFYKGYVFNQIGNVKKNTESVDSLNPLLEKLELNWRLEVRNADSK